MRLALCLAFLLACSCAVPTAPTAEDGEGGGAPAVDTADAGAQLGEAEDVGEAADEELKLSDCEQGCMEFAGAPCDTFTKACKGKPDYQAVIWGEWKTTCYWALHLACGSKQLELHQCFLACRGDS